MNKGSHGCIYYPGIPCTDEKNMLSKVVNSKPAKWELAICEIVKKIPHYKRYFVPIESSCLVLSKKVKPCNVLNSEKKIMIMNMPFIKTLPETFGLEHYVEILTSIELLLHYKLVHFDIKYENVVFTPRPLLIDFGISLNMRDINLNAYFYFFQPSYFMWPIDVHLIGYMINVSDAWDSKTLTQVCTDVYNKSPYLHKIDECIQHYNYLITSTREESIQKLLKGWKTWDLYSATVMLFKNVQVNSLLPMFHCDSSKRLTTKAARIASRLTPTTNCSSVA